MRKLFSYLLIVAMLISSTVPVKATDYSQNESYWYNVCQGKVNEGVKKECDGFTEYLNQKANDLKEKLKEFDKMIAEIKGDLKKLEKVAAEIQVDIDVVNAKIEKIEVKIAALEEKIQFLENDIVLKEQEIIMRDEQIKQRMTQTQIFNKTNGYLDFIMGASDFIDLIRRISVMNQITAFEQDQIHKLNEAIIVLENNKGKLEVSKGELEGEKSVLDKDKAELEEMKKRQNVLIAEYKQKEEDLMDAYINTEESMESIKENMPNYYLPSGESVTTSSWGPICTGEVTAGTWHYPKNFGGGRHSGMDIAGPNGTPVKAPFNGIIVIAQNVTNKGGLGVTPMTGNNVMLIGEVGGKVYAVHLLHLKYNSITVKVGDIVNKGQVIAARGSTGNSTGPHVHIDIYNLGNVYTVESAYNYIRRTGSYTFGMPYKANGWECENKKPVCKARPEDFDLVG